MDYYSAYKNKATPWASERRAGFLWIRKDVQVEK